MTITEAIEATNNEAATIAADAIAMRAGEMHDHLISLITAVGGADDETVDQAHSLILEISKLRYWQGRYEAGMAAHVASTQGRTLIPKHEVVRPIDFIK